MKTLASPLIKSIVFIVVTTLATALLAMTIANRSNGDGVTYKARFSDVTSLNVGDDVRMAGVRVGKIDDIEIADRRVAEVTFSVAKDTPVLASAEVAIKYRNLVGQRYVAIDQGVGVDQQPPSQLIGLDRTSPALDLTVLFDGFKPLFAALSPQDVNKLSYEIIQVFQGEGGTIEDLLASTASLTTTLAGKDKVIGEVVDNLNVVLDTVNSKGQQLSTLVQTLRQLVTGLAADRGSIGGALDGMAALSTSTADLLNSSRAPLKDSVHGLNTLTNTLVKNEGTVDSFLKMLPQKFNDVGRVASYGSFMNFYLCEVSGRIPVPQGYYGGVGVQATPKRCSP